MTDGEYRYLLRRALQGDSDALGRILMAFRGPVENNICRFLVKFRMESYADDLVQDTFLLAVAGFHRYDPVGGNIHPWLKQIATNVCLRWARDNQVALAEGPISVEGDDPDEPIDRTDATCATVWTADATAEPVIPPRMDAKSDPARRPQTKRRHVGQGHGGGHPVQLAPDHVLRNRELYASVGT